MAEAMEKVGKDGVITVEDPRRWRPLWNSSRGCGWIGLPSPYFVTDPERMEVALDQPLILLHEKRSTRCMTSCRFWSRPLSSAGLLIIAEDVEGEALSTLVVNKLRGALNVAAVKAPGFGDRRKEMLDDIAILTGGQVISEDLGVELRKVPPSWVAPRR